MPASIYSRYYGLSPVAIDDKVSLAQRPMPQAEAYPDALIHILVGGETLDQLAYNYYGREDLWWRIADANPTVDLLSISAGTRLVIPPLRVATRTSGG
jgi:hypothetical protein